MDSKVADAVMTGVTAGRSSVARRLEPSETLGSPSVAADLRGPAASLLRDSIFRRMLLGADALAIAGAFLLTMALSSRSLQLTWASMRLACRSS